MVHDNSPNTHIIKTSECGHVYWWPSTHCWVPRTIFSVEVEFTEFVSTIFRCIPPALLHFWPIFDTRIALVIIYIHAKFDKNRCRNEGVMCELTIEGVKDCMSILVRNVRKYVM